VSWALHSEVSPSPQGKFIGANLGAQTSDAPSHVSSGSHNPLPGRQTAPSSFVRSTHVPVALQLSAALHSVASGLPHGVSSGSKTWAHTFDVPSQRSAGSHAGLPARQMVPADFFRSMQAPAASQLSAALQAVVSGFPHAVSSGFLRSTQLPVALQLSAALQPAASGLPQAVSWGA
jgi:hypothetical protein